MSSLTLYNSMSKRREPFQPIDPDNVRVYVCGPTVYDLAHVGNARGMTVFDVLVRLLRAHYPKVTYVRNVTDVDDKINERAARLGKSIDAVTAQTTEQFHADMAALGNLPPDHEPRATSHVAEMLVLIGKLVENGNAYAADGHVLFAVDRFAGYGALSGRTPDELLAGARVEVAPYKHHPGDFVLWKPSPPELPGWDSQWGRGRPGWHIECSAMAWRYLGETFDIHGGGGDLIFPHHENERAQSLCAMPGSGFARFWLHNGMLLSEGEKMSKSLNNFTTIRDALGQARGEAIRALLLRAQYRSTLEFGSSGLVETRGELDRFYRALQRAPAVQGPVPGAAMEALCDDLNTPAAFATMHALADRAMKGDGEAAAGLKAAGGLLGLLQQSPDAWFQGGVDAVAVEAAIAERILARRGRNFSRADAIRTEWLARGVVFEDKPDGTTLWRQVSEQG